MDRVSISDFSVAAYAGSTDGGNGRRNKYRMNSRKTKKGALSRQIGIRKLDGNVAGSESGRSDGGSITGEYNNIIWVWIEWDTDQKPSGRARLQLHQPRRLDKFAGEHDASAATLAGGEAEFKVLTTSTQGYQTIESRHTISQHNSHSQSKKSEVTDVRQLSLRPTYTDPLTPSPNLPSPPSIR